MRRYKTDVLIVGGGGAGLMAAHEAAKQSVSVAVVNKGKVQRTGATIMAPGAIAAVDERWKVPEDSKGTHIKDTIEGGGYINDPDMVETMVNESPSLVLELEQMGSIFQRQPDGTHFMLRIDGGHSYPRCPFLEDRTGKEMVKAMASGLRKQRVAIYEDITIIKLLKHNDAICGAVGVDAHTLETVLFECKAIILATGGVGNLYENTDNPVDVTGDGFALALKCGAALRDMEFVQFFPLGFVFPKALSGTLAGLLYYCRLLNKDGERFMEKYDPERLELSTRDRVARAIVQEVREGRGTANGGVYMDLTFQTEEFLETMTPALYATYRSIGIDPTKEYIEVYPTVHFFMGGLDVGLKWDTSIAGLYGAGEVCGGMHGGNRLSQNALAEVLVSGKISGKSAAEYAKIAKSWPCDPVEVESTAREMIEGVKSDDGVSPISLRIELKRIMTELAGVIRSQSSLEEALSRVEELEKKRYKISQKSHYMNSGISLALENQNMLLTAKAILISALARRESRSAHYREDYPDTDNADFMCNHIVKLDGCSLAVSSRPVKQRTVRPEVG